MSPPKRETITQILFRPYYVGVVALGIALFCGAVWLTDNQDHQSNQTCPTPPPAATPVSPPVSTDLILVGDVLHEQLRRRPRHEVSQKGPEPVLADFAAEYLGGTITSSSPTYRNTSAITTFIGIPLFYDTPNPPSIMLHRSVYKLKEDDHWKMEGRRGNFSLALYEPTIIHSFGYRHANITDVSAAPSHFEFSVSSNRNESPQSVGRWVYNATIGGLQRYYLEKPVTAQFVVVRVLSNHGNFDFTTMYRFFVFGERGSRSLIELF